MKTYPDKFLGRCQICLDNAVLSNEPCKSGYGNGVPLSKEDCPIYMARKRYDEAQTDAR